jgi:hypothetical protein
VVIVAAVGLVAVAVGYLLSTGPVAARSSEPTAA